MKKLALFALIVVLGCSNGIQKPEPQPVGKFAKGADISWVTQMESWGRKFYNAQGAPMECTALMKSLGMNSIRLRVWVNPEYEPQAGGTWCNKEDVLEKALRAKKLGMRLMVDFHYSDWWADPGKQNIPAAWKSYNLEQMCQAVADHTKEVLMLLKNNDIAVEWVQVGNETNTGMLWGMGEVKNNDFANYAALNNAGYDAVKEVYANALVIIQHGNATKTDHCLWLFDGLTAAGGRWDVAGFFVYPHWAELHWRECNERSLETFNRFIAKYNKPVMVCETGYQWDKPQEGKDFLTDLLVKCNTIPEGKCLGVLYWEPQCYDMGYQLGSFDLSGKPTAALDAFR